MADGFFRRIIDIFRPEADVMTVIELEDDGLTVYY